MSDLSRRGSRVALTVGLCLTVAAASAGPAWAQTAQGQKTLSQMLSEREQRAAQSRQSNGSKIFGAVVGLGVAYACGAFNQQQTAQQRQLCALGATVAGYGAYLLGKEITKNLQAKDQKKVLAAASESLRTGEPAALELPDSRAQASVTPPSTIVTKE
ncbi:MAG: hypothetical protein AB1716_26910, partial [Planctomycetota bacterium]